jgi:hypothetical protein
VRTGCGGLEVTRDHHHLFRMVIERLRIALRKFQGMKLGMGGDLPGGWWRADRGRLAKVIEEDSSSEFGIGRLRRQDAKIDGDDQSASRHLLAITRHRL